MNELSGRPHMSASPPLGEDAIREAAAETLRQWPGAEAAILFGSRARGDHRPNSDWDIAIVTGNDDGCGPADIALRRMEGDSRVEILSFTRERLRSKCNAPGHVGFDIARQGRLLAGCWQPPALMKNAHMQPEEFRNWFGGACSNLATAITQLVEVARTGSVFDASNFVAATADMAELLVKGMVCRHTGRPPSRTHDADVLLGELPEPLRSEAAGLNGSTKQHHVAQYKVITPTDCRNAGARAVLTLNFLVRELADAQRDSSLKDIAEDVAVALLHRMRDWPEALRVPVDEGAIGARVVWGDEEVVLATAIAQCKPLAVACDAATTELERMLASRSEGL